MENKFVVNIIHRPELSPEYASGRRERARACAMNRWIFSEHKGGEQ
jgi:hypothetical protein